MLCLGLDAATKTGFALIAHVPRETLLDHGVLDLHGAAASQINVLVERVRKAVHLAGGTMAGLLVAIEEPYLDKNPKTLKVLARIVGRLEQAFEAQGCGVELVTASEWQGAVLAGFGGRRRDGLKKAALIWCRAHLGVPVEQDVADAAGLAVHMLRREAIARAAQASHAEGRR